MNPIDKITDPTFTNSSKGLLSLFCIGLAHIVIGVDLTSTEIAIPWLPSINFSNTDRLPYLYWALVGFAMYRYTLHNLLSIKEIYFTSLGRYLSSEASGKKFIDDMIFSPETIHQVEVKNNTESLPIITIKHFEYDDEEEQQTHEDRGWECAMVFEITFSNEYDFHKIKYSENPSYSLDGLALGNAETRKSWGLTQYIEDYQEPSFSSTNITGFILRNKLRYKVLCCYFKVLVSSKDTFDLLIPLALNCLLFIYAVTGI
jgi:hypothetical protein